METGYCSVPFIDFLQTIGPTIHFISFKSSIYLICRIGTITVEVCTCQGS